MFRTLLLAAVLILPFAPTASAGLCPPSSAMVTLDVPSQGRYHIGEDGHLYLESNRFQGLQASAGTCVDENGRDINYVADTLVA